MSSNQSGKQHANFKFKVSRTVTRVQIFSLSKFAEFEIF
ncbi:hypothetical protein CSUNSWCD_875 [Campylobacter showae CSUNSWCD]|uniref:Uncharacterized protein n=1 Tax=Campylobacter showae CSUNSWCD TaxID=1244083 RepID=M5INT8_9BACT|nr:hypothetical protein CSUNSWCD_875 [Campylobacter showae CSUNSWCD]